MPLKKKPDNVIKEFEGVLDTLRTKPWAAMNAGLINIMTDESFCDPVNNSVLKMVQETKNRDGLIVEKSATPLIPNPAQEYFFSCWNHYVDNRIPFIANVLKARAHGMTTGIQGAMATKISTVPLSNTLTIAHRTPSAKRIYQVLRYMVKYSSPILNCDFSTDTIEEFRVSNPRFGVVNNSARNVGVTSIESVRGGDRYIIILESESSQYANQENVTIESFEEATNSLLVNSPYSANIRETTGNGEDEIFFPKFMSAWERQGRKNPHFGRGFPWFESPEVSIFLPWYFSHVKRQEMPKGVLHNDLYSDLDPYEENLYKSISAFLTSINDKLKMDREGIHNEALCRLQWRRSKILTDYKHWKKAPPAGGSVSSRKSFQREEPATVDEAFAITIGRTLIDDRELEKIKNDHVRPPEACGEIVDGEFVDYPREDAFNKLPSLRIWKHPSECGDLIASYDPCSGKAMDSKYSDGRHDVDKKRDAHGFVIFDIGTGEQVAEYISQQKDGDVAKVIGSILTFFASRGKDSNGDDNWPYLIWESNFGQVFREYIMNVMNYPSHKIYRHKDSNLKTAGKRGAVGLPASNVTNNECASFLQEMIASNRMFIRSFEIYRQLCNYVEIQTGSGRPKYQSNKKNKDSMDRFDDLADACGMCAYYIKNLIDRQVDIEFSDGNEDDPGEELTGIAAAILEHAKKMIEPEGVYEEPWYDEPI